MVIRPLNPRGTQEIRRDQRAIWFEATLNSLHCLAKLLDVVQGCFCRNNIAVDDVVFRSCFWGACVGVISRGIRPYLAQVCRLRVDHIAAEPRRKKSWYSRRQRRALSPLLKSASMLTMAAGSGVPGRFGPRTGIWCRAAIRV